MSLENSGSFEEYFTSRPNSEGDPSCGGWSKARSFWDVRKSHLPDYKM